MDVEWRLCSSRIGVASLDEEGHDDARCGGEKVVTCLKAQSLLLSTKDVPLEMKGEESHFLKECKVSLSLKEVVFDGTLKMDFNEGGASLVDILFLKERSLFLHDESFLFISR